MESLCAIAAAKVDARTVVVALESVENCLQVYEEIMREQDLVVNALVTRLRGTVAFDQLASLAAHANSDITVHARSIQEQFFAANKS